MAEKPDTISEFVVTEKAMRPASPERRCFYCHQAIGDFHKDGCVLISKWVTVKATITMDIEVPSWWDKHDVEFHRNEGTWCGSNMTGDIERYQDYKQKLCICDEVEYEYIKDNSERFLMEVHE